MTLTRIKATKNKGVWRYEGETKIDNKAASVRSRFATPGKHQLYADKRDEAVRYLAAAKGQTVPNLADYPFLEAEVGVSAASPRDLAELWIAMDKQWKKVAAGIERLTISAKARIRAANSQAEIDSVIAETAEALDAIGDKPPERPGNGKSDRNPNRPTPAGFDRS
jgi:hypothetical protein